MRNFYFFARHGKSLANEQGVIVSDPGRGIAGFGLTEEGKVQVRVSAEEVKQSDHLDETALIVSSDFMRARETAEIIGEVLGASQATLTSKLRERCFGNWEQQDTCHYQDVWAKDQHDSSCAENGVESVDHVLARARALVAELENMHEGRDIILVSHGDVLQILQTSFMGMHPSQHRALRPLDIAEIRGMADSIVR